MTLIERMNAQRLPGQVEQITDPFDTAHLRVLDTRELLALLSNVQLHIKVGELKALLARYLDPATLARVTSIELKTSSEYNDNTYDTVLEDFTLYDVTHQPVEPAFDSTWWASPLGVAYPEDFLKRHKGNHFWYAKHYGFPLSGTPAQQLAWAVAHLQKDDEHADGPHDTLKDGISDIVDLDSDSTIHFSSLQPTPPLLAYEHGEDFSSLFN